MELLCLKSCLFNKKNEKGFLNDIDLSNYFRLRLIKTSIEEIIVFIYPRIYILDKCIEIKEGDFPETINAKLDSLNNGTLFIVDNGFYLSLYCTKNIKSLICKDFFNVNSFEEINYREVYEKIIFLMGKMYIGHIRIKLEQLLII